ncbi:MAG: hypothetical protein WD534_07480 [Phycisphaeraceae bacterium]
MTDIDPQTHERSEELVELIRVTRQHLRRNAVLAGAALLVVAAVTWLALASAVDLLVALPVALRVAAFAGLWVVVLTVAAVAVLWPAVRPMSLERVAFQIERVLGNMHNRLVTVLDLRSGKREVEPASLPLIDRLVQQTADRLSDYDVRRVASPAFARRCGVAAAVVLVVAGLATGLFYEYSSNALARVLQPTKAIPPVAWVRLAAEPGDVQVMQGESVTLQGVVQRGSVERLTLRLVGDDGRAVRYPMQADGDSRFRFTLEQVEADHAYQIAGGGTWTLPHTIRVLRRPMLEQIDAHVHLPGYMRRPEPVAVSQPTDQISAPVGSHVRLAATVRGHASEGQVHLYDTVTKTHERIDERETVWFDDDTPADAELIGQWRWMDETVHSGSRAHTFGWSREPYGFRTTLNRLPLEPDENLFVWVRLDADAPPERLTLDVHQPDDRTHRLIWTTAERREEAEGEGGVRLVRELPAEGEWARLEVTAEELLGNTPNEATQLSGLQFAIDGGRAVFDRAGAVSRTTREVEERAFVKQQSVAMRRDETTGLWMGDVRVEEDVRYAIELKNEAGHASAAMQPVPIMATRDQPPGLIVERPGRNLTLAEPEPLPLAIRTFDDYGVAEVRLQVSTSAEGLDDAESQALATFDEDAPRTSRQVTGALDPEAHGLSVEQAVHYRIVVRDTKGQEAVSEPYRLAMVQESDEAFAEAERRTPLDGVLDGLGGLLEAQADLAGGALEMLARLPEGLQPRIDEDGAFELVDDEGNVLSDEEVAERLAQWREEGMSEEDRAAWSAMEEQLAQQREQLHDMAAQLSEAAAAAGESPFAMTGEQQALQQMADRAAAMAAAAGPADADAAGDTVDPDVLERLAELEALSDEEQAELAALEEELRQLMGAQQQLAADPAESQASMQNLMAQMHARSQAQQMSQLESHLAAERANLEQLRGRVESMREQTAAAEAEQLDAISEQQADVDAEALAAMQRADELLAARAAEEEDDIALPPAPWTPPGETREQTPVEHDTPEEATDAEGEGDADQLADAGETGEEESADWWDEPVETPDMGAQAEMAERYENRDEREVPTAEAAEGEAGGEPEPQTPREMLDDHQQRLASALQARGQQLADAQGEAGDMRAALEQAMAAQDAAAMQAQLQSPGMQQAMAMAAAAAMQQQQAAAGEAGGEAAGEGMPGAPGMTGMASGMGPADPMAAGSGEGQQPGGIVYGAVLEDVEGTGPAMYRLPPTLRQPMLQGMRERGPAAYQRLIDAYYEQLSERVGEDGE